MKFIVAFLVIFIGLAWCGHIHDDGQPGCKTEIELQVVNYRNNWDPTTYWVCEVLGQPAKEAKCSHGTAWLDSKKECVEWHDWIWEVPSEPESRP